MPTSTYTERRSTSVDQRLRRRRRNRDGRVLAQQISAIAQSAGARIDPSGVSRLELALDTPDHERVAPFWAAVLDRELIVTDGWADVGDRGQVNPLICFQPSGGENRGSGGISTSSWPRTRSTGESRQPSQLVGS